MRCNDLAGKAVVIWGAGREGLTAHTDLAAYGISTEFALTGSAAAPTDLPAPVHTGEAAMERLLSADAVVKSPGIPHTSPEYQTLVRAGVPITSLVDLWLTENRDRVIGVTGTKGKSTTASLIHHVLSSAGIRSSLAGNIGIPVSLPLDPSIEAAVTEISSYQAAELSSPPRVAVITSLYPEHLPWHGTYERYVHDKLRLIATGPASVVIPDHDDTLQAAVKAHAHADAHIITPASLGIDLTGASLEWRGVGHVELSELPLHGMHNLANAAVALAAATIFEPNGDRAALLNSLRTFAPLSHRLETVPSTDGRTWIDDGLATAPEAVIAALTAFAGRDITLIAGGAERTLDYGLLVETLTERFHASSGVSATAPSLRVVTTGPAGARLAGLLRDAGVPVTHAPHFAAALSHAEADTPPGGVILLSPAAPSFDEFADYEARSAVFRERARIARPAGAAPTSPTANGAPHEQRRATDERSSQMQQGLVRPEVSAADACLIASECYGLEVSATELGSNQDRNYLLTAADGMKRVLRIDNEVFTDDARDGQHAALDAYRAAGVPVASVLPGLDGNLTQRWNGFAVRLNEFAEGESLVDAGYLAPIVIQEFGSLAAASVNALRSLSHSGLDREHMWDMRVAHQQTQMLAPSITDPALRQRILDSADAAWRAIEPVAAALPVQAIHGDLTDDNVMGRRGADSRLHPHTVLDLGDLSLGWRVAELAVTISSLLHHEPLRPLRVLEAIDAFHRDAALSIAEARAVWPLMVLRASLLVASGHRQLEIDGDNEYARERTAGEQAIFDAATRVSIAEATELVLERLGYEGIAEGDRLSPVPTPEAVPGEPLRSLLPDLTGEVHVLDPGVESDALAAGAWLARDAESHMIEEAFGAGAVAAVLPYGVYRLTRTAIDSADGADTWPIDAEVRLAGDAQQRVTAPITAAVVSGTADEIVLRVQDGWHVVISGVTPTVSEGQQVVAGEVIGSVADAPLVTSAESDALSPRRLVIGLRREDAWEHGLDHPRIGRAPRFVAPELVPAWLRLSHDPATLLGIPSLVQWDESAEEQQRREQIFASAQERYYERPMQIERGWRHHLIDTTGRSYVDMVNNVAGLGHGHPGVADAVNRQIRVLNTNSRFLYRELAEYSERLLAKLPEGSGLDTVLLVNSGSEAVDLALRLAQAATGRKTVVALREAYHGWTMASDGVTTSAFDNPYALSNRPDWVHIADVPNRFRGTYRGDADDRSVGQRYAADLSADLSKLAAEGRDVAGFICESVLGNAGGVLLPEGYLAEVYRMIREAGGLCIADEVQVGFGRMGSTFWGFEQSGVIPDIITIAKPMGNGFPIGGVITSKEIADGLASQGQFFASTGGNPLSCRVGMAVLDAMEHEGLQANAKRVGERLVAGFTALAEKHALIGPIHGEGLYLGVELVRDHETMEPATEEADAICERLRELGVIVLTTSERSNVLKVKPPLCLTEQSADFVVAQLDRVLTEGW